MNGKDFFICFYDTNSNDSKAVVAASSLTVRQFAESLVWLTRHNAVIKSGSDVRELIVENIDDIENAWHGFYTTKLIYLT